MIRVTSYTEDYKQKLLNGLTDFTYEQKLELCKNLENIGENEEFLICLDQDENFVGFSKTTSLTKGFINLDYIYVIPSLRRDKNGSVILVAVMNRAVNRLVLGMFAKCESSNQSAMAFLKARGFIVSEEQNGVSSLMKSLMHMYKTHHDH